LRLHYLYHFLFSNLSTSELYTLSLHDALPICYSRLHGSCSESCAPDIPGSRAISSWRSADHGRKSTGRLFLPGDTAHPSWATSRSEEHTSELQSRGHLVCRLLLEIKKQRQ